MNDLATLLHERYTEPWIVLRANTLPHGVDDIFSFLYAENCVYCARRRVNTLAQIGVPVIVSGEEDQPDSLLAVCYVCERQLMHNVVQESSLHHHHFTGAAHHGGMINMTVLQINTRMAGFKNVGLIDAVCLSYLIKERYDTSRCALDGSVEAALNYFLRQERIRYLAPPCPDATKQKDVRYLISDVQQALYLCHQELYDAVKAGGKC